MRVLGRLAGAGALLVVLLVLVEVLFRLGGLVVRTLPQGAEDGRPVVLCVGDSHTRGRPDPDNYPAALERILARTGRPWRVINVGVPGQNTAQVRNRFERYLDYYRPAVVLFWGGVNNSWNQAETQLWHRPWWQRLLDHSRVVRFVRVWLFYRGLKRATDAAPTIKLREWKELGKSRYDVNFGGVVDEIGTDSGTGEHLSAERLEAVTYQDLSAMMRAARERAVPMYALQYPIRALTFEPVNRAIEHAATEAGVPWVDTAATLARFGDRPREELYDAWAHPTPMVYAAIADDVYALLVAQGVVAAR